MRCDHRHVVAGEKGADLVPDEDARHRVSM
jgi:hypothetical protein